MIKNNAEQSFFSKNQEVIKGVLLGVTSLSLLFLGLLLVLGYISFVPFTAWLISHLAVVIGLGIFAIGTSLTLLGFSLVFKQNPSAEADNPYTHQEPSPDPSIKHEVRGSHGDVMDRILSPKLHRVKREDDLPTLASARHKL